MRFKQAEINLQGQSYWLGLLMSLEEELALLRGEDDRIRGRQDTKRL